LFLFDEGIAPLSAVTGRVAFIESGSFDCFSRSLAGSCFSIKIASPLRLSPAGWFLPEADFLITSAAFWLVLAFPRG
jgi:hypothetical protein